MFTCLRRNHWILIVLTPKEQKAYYLDSLKTQARLKTKLIESVLDDALKIFSCMVGSNLLNTTEGPTAKNKLNHVTDIGCVQKARDITPADYYLCWHMDSFVKFQDHIHKAGDFKKYCIPMEDPEFHDEFDYKLEFSRIQKLFVSVINKEVIMNTGLFYYGDDTQQNSS